jgi:hypothetical protein
MGQERTPTALELRAPQGLGLGLEDDYLLFDVVERTTTFFKGHSLGKALEHVLIPAQGLRLFCLRPLPPQGACHVWGGKRIAEDWHDQSHKLSLAIAGPAGLRETVFLTGLGPGIEEVQVNGQTQPFFFDPAKGLVHGEVTFTAAPLRIEALGSTNTSPLLPRRPIAAGPLAQVQKR